MTVSVAIERVKANRCPSNILSKPGCTHWCHIVARHEGEHRCICSVTWPGVKS